MERNVCIFQSGGPTCVINTSLLGIYEMAKKLGYNKIYGSLYGVEGLIKDNLIDLNKEDPKEMKLLRQTPGAILGSARHFLNEEVDEEYGQIVDTIKKHNINQLLIIGGNDSMDSTNKLSKYFKQIELNCNVVGVPKTIDNDLVNIDVCPGYISAAKYIANIVHAVKQDTESYDKGRVTVVEIMGRDSGFLTAAAKLADADLIYLPEVVFDIDSFLAKVKDIYSKNKKCLVAVSEGLKDASGNYVMNLYKYLADNDVFGHQQLGGVGNVLCDLVHEKLGFAVRAIELNLTQRCASFLSSNSDLDIAYELGVHALYLSQHSTGLMASLIDGELTSVSSDDVANKIKKVPLEWIEDGNLNDGYLKFIHPYLQEESEEISYTNGLVKFAKLNKVKVG